MKKGSQIDNNQQYRVCDSSINLSTWLWVSRAVVN
jgi:hypothetical protein